MDPLTQQLMQRAMAQPQQPGQPPPPDPFQAQPNTTPVPGLMPSQGQPVPSVPPSGGQTNTPPQAQRYANAQAMMQAYRNNWNPNPILLQAQNR